jgi:hypothetical protein
MFADSALAENLPPTNTVPRQQQEHAVRGRRDRRLKPMPLFVRIQVPPEEQGYPISPCEQPNCLSMSKVYKTFTFIASAQLWWRPLRLARVGLAKSARRVDGPAEAQQSHAVMPRYHDHGQCGPG